MKRAARRPHAVPQNQGFIPWQKDRRKEEREKKERERRGRRIRERRAKRRKGGPAERMTNRGSKGTDRGGLTAKGANRRVNTLLTLRRGGRKPNGIRSGDLVGGLRRPPAATAASTRASSLRTASFLLQPFPPPNLSPGRSPSRTVCGVHHCSR